MAWTWKLVQRWHSYVERLGVSPFAMSYYVFTTGDLSSHSRSNDRRNVETDVLKLSVLRFVVGNKVWRCTSTTESQMPNQEEGEAQVPVGPPTTEWQCHPAQTIKIGNDPRSKYAPTALLIERSCGPILGFRLNIHDGTAGTPINNPGKMHDVKEGCNMLLISSKPNSHFMPLEDCYYK